MALQPEAGNKVGPGDWVESRAGNIVLGTATVAAIAAVVVAAGLTLALPAFAAFTALLALVSRIDLREHRIPKRMVHHAAAIAVPLLLLASLADIEGASLVGAAIGGIGLFAFYYLLELVYPAGMGRGDVRLAPYIGAHLGFLGWDVWRNGVLATFLLMAVVGLLLMVTKVASRKSRIPHAPFMAVGAVAAAVWGLGL